jgi:hypothetical protein
MLSSSKTTKQAVSQVHRGSESHRLMSFVFEVFGIKGRDEDVLYL